MKKITTLLIALFAINTHLAAQLIKAQRTSGIAPLGVHFTVNDHDWNHLKDYDYEWRFSDGDTAIGFQAVHVFQNSGTVTLIVTRPDFTTETETITITVADPDIAYTASNTTCFSNSGDFTGCPAGAATVTTSNLSGVTFAAHKRFLFHQGDTFSLPGTKTLFAGTQLASYGSSGVQPVISVGGDATTTTFWMQDSITVTDLAFIGEEWVLSSAWGGTMYGEGRLFAPENHATFHNLTVRNMTAFAIMDDGIGAKNNFVASAIDAENLGSYFLYSGPSPAMQYSGVVDCNIRNVFAHGIRMNGGQFFIANNVAIDSVERSQITYRGLRYGIVSDSRFTGKGFYKNSIRNMADDASVSDTVRYIIYERNLYSSRKNEFGFDFNIGSDIVVRNNILLNSSFNIGFNLSGVIPQRVEIMNNTFYQNNYEHYPEIILRNGSTGIFKGNIAYADNFTGGCIAENPISAASTENTTQWSIDNNAYYVSGDAAGSSFKNGMSFAAWQALGMDANSNYGTMEFVNKTTDESSADFMPVSGTMLNLTEHLTHRDFYGNRRNTSGNNDAGAIEKDGGLSIRNLQHEIAMILYPNPATQHLTIGRKQPSKAKLFVKNTIGQVVYEQQLSKANEFVDIAQLAPGLYLLMLSTEDGGFATKKFVKH